MEEKRQGNMKRRRTRGDFRTDNPCEEEGTLLKKL